MKETRVSVCLVVISAILLCLICGSRALAGGVVFYRQDGAMTAVGDPNVKDPASALNALVEGPAAFGAGNLVSAIPAGTKVKGLKIEGESVSVDFSRDILANLDEVTLELIFKQVLRTLGQFGLDKDLKLTVEGRLLSSYLKPAPEITPGPPIGATAAAVMGALTGYSITLSPGHGVFWNGSGWYTQRPVYCAPLNEEDFHNLENSQYLKTYLENDGMLVKMCREVDKSVCCHSSGYPWWKMAAYLYLQQVGYPCSVYASYTGDCTTGTGASESNDDIRARPLASDYDNTSIYISLHTNGSAGDCYGTSCPTGSDVYYDCSSEHAAWCTVSSNLATDVNSAMISAIHGIADPSWVNRGIHDSNGAYGEIRIPDRAAILIELGFHDSCDLDALDLRDNYFRTAAMWGIYKGVCDYFGVVPTWGYYSDEYVSDDIPASIAPGETVTAHITLRNKGVLWTEARQIRLGAVDDTDPFSASNRYGIAGEVGPNDTYTFTLTLTAPTTEGTYLTDWRMVRDGVTWFGVTVSKVVQVGGAPDTEPPTVPQNLTATAVSPSQIDLSWTASTDNVGVSGYRIYRDGVQIGSSLTTAYSDTTCQSNTVYAYEVSAYDGAGNESAKSLPAYAATPPQTDYIIDNPAASFIGLWSTGTMSTDKYGADYRYAGTAASETATAEWRPSLDVGGYYDVYCWYPQGTNRSAAAPFTVFWDGGSQTAIVNQQVNGGRWNLLVGSKPFLAGTTGCVKLGNGTGESSLVVMADAIRFVKVEADTTPPIISNVAASIWKTTAGITWTTDEGSTSQVEYGETASYGSITPLDSSIVTSHAVDLSGLTRKTTYHYRVRSKDAAGNEAVSGDYTFRTR